METLTSPSQTVLPLTNDALITESPKPLKASALKQIDSTSLPLDKLQFEHLPTLPVEVWQAIFSFLGTKQGVVPLLQVSKVFNVYVGPLINSLPDADVDYSSPLANAIKSFKSPFSCGPHDIRRTWSPGFVATGCVEGNHDLYQLVLKPSKRNDAAHNETPVEFTRRFVGPFDQQKLVINHLVELTENIFVIAGNELCILNFKKCEHKKLQEDASSITHLFKINDFSFAAITQDYSMMIWDIEKGVCVNTIEEVVPNEAKIATFIKLTKENGCVIQLNSGILSLDIATNAKSKLISHITWSDDKHQNTMFPIGSNTGSVCTIDRMSDDKLALCWRSHCIVTNSANIFSEAELNSENSHFIQLNTNYRLFRALPNNCIAYIGRSANWHQYGALKIYDLNKEEIVFDYDLEGGAITEMLLLTDQRILVYTKDGTFVKKGQITIFPFAVKK